MCREQQPLNQDAVYASNQDTTHTSHRILCQGNQPQVRHHGSSRRHNRNPSGTHTQLKAISPPAPEGTPRPRRVGWRGGGGGGDWQRSRVTLCGRAGVDVSKQKQQSTQLVTSVGGSSSFVGLVYSTQSYTVWRSETQMACSNSSHMWRQSRPIGSNPNLSILWAELYSYPYC